MAIAFDIIGANRAHPPLKEASRPAVLPAPEHVHSRYAQKIRRHIGRVMGFDHEHEDLVQDVLLTVVRKLPTVRDPSRIDGWIAQVTTNTLRLTMRRRSMGRRALGTFLAHQGDGSFQPDVEARNVADRAMRVIDRLSREEQALLVARWFTPGTENALAASIAAKSGCSVFTIRRRLTRARKRFEKLARKDPALAQRFGDEDPTPFVKRERRAPDATEP